MVKDHSDSKRGNLLPPHGLLFSSKVFLYAPSHRQDRTFHSLCYTSRGGLAGMINGLFKMKEGNVLFNDTLNTFIIMRNLI